MYTYMYLSSYLSLSIYIYIYIYKHVYIGITLRDLVHAIPYVAIKEGDLTAPKKSDTTTTTTATTTTNNNDDNDNEIMKLIISNIFYLYLYFMAAYGYYNIQVPKKNKKNIFSGRILEIEGLESLKCEQARAPNVNRL